MDAQYVNDIELAGHLGIARITLRTWRTKGQGPPFYKLGRKVVYEMAEVAAWMKSQRVE